MIAKANRWRSRRYPPKAEPEIAIVTTAICKPA